MALPSLLDLLFPPKCVICQKLLPHGEVICSECARKLPFTTDAQTKSKVDFTEGCYAPFFYEEPLRAAFLRYKFRGYQHYARCFGKWMADCLIRQDQTDFDLVTFAPLSCLRRWKRGYDQSRLLAEEIAGQLALPLAVTLVKAYRKPLSQLEGERSVRAARIMGAYTLYKGAAVKGKRILLVDDITTSGATLSECAQVLKQAGAAEITCITLAQKRHK